MDAPNAADGSEENRTHLCLKDAEYAEPNHRTIMGDAAQQKQQKVAARMATGWPGQAWGKQEKETMQTTHK